MSEDLLRYDLMIEAALREVVYQTMARAAKEGLPGEHHFYITFSTNNPGVEIPDYLRQQYPEEMTIVLQHQFYNLKVDKDGFSVSLSFKNVRERLGVPFAAITAFADPSVNFALQFQSAGGEADEEEDGASAGKTKGKRKTPDGETPKEEKRGEVISLDKFRKKPT